MPMETINFNDLRLADGDRVLDLGCGEGRHCITAYLLGQVESVGVDLSLGDLGTTRERFLALEQAPCQRRSLTLAVSDGQHLPFADQTFDKIICSEVLEHIHDYPAVLDEIVRVLRPGGILAVSVPRFFPEWVCWRLSDAYHAMEGGHVRIFNASQLTEDIEALGFVRYRRHWAHALHVPYWWLKCAFWREEGEKDAAVVRTYHRFLVWDLMGRPWITRALEWLLNPIMGKSVVMYFVKEARGNER
ncbi:MAG: class I SAM-dependent methyltransferase [Gammaproteobacteria bacterium]|nr:class I SAM-dependent methyltransferase [Gammaproteobacteria bacterium]